MTALFLAPIYILINIYVVRWMILWMGACSYLFQSVFFRAFFIIVYILLSTSLLSGFLIKRPAALHRLLKKTGDYFLGTFFYILLVILFMDAGRLILRYVFHASWINSRAAFVMSGGICVLLIIALSVHGIAHTWNLKTAFYNVKVSKHASDMESLKIVLVADTHFGYGIGHIHARQLADAINKEKPDLVCFAGDMFDNNYDAIQYPNSIKNSLKSIRAKYGVYACWGNHDLNEPILAGFTFRSSTPHYDDPRMVKLLKDANIHILEDETILINNSFYIIGRKDKDRAEKMQETRKTPAQLTEKLDRSKPIILMDHQPKNLMELAEAGVDISLCGHTHNGQLFPGNLFLRLLWENPRGYLKKKHMHNIVTSGAGVWGPTMRVGTDSEICSITVTFSHN